jgi:hypothetical protein
MSKDQVLQLRPLEGRRVSVALRNGLRLDDCQLVSIGRRRSDRIWLFINGSDWFVRLRDVVDIWEVRTANWHQ